jgi:hypothetical protein
MTTHTIGYALSQTRSNSQTHLAFSLFYNEKALSHLAWVATIYPKNNDPDLNKEECCKRLSNYIQYYHKESTLVVGGDQTAILGVYRGYTSPSHLLLLSHEPCGLAPLYNQLDATLLSELADIKDAHSTISIVGYIDIPQQEASLQYIPWGEMAIHPDIYRQPDKDLILAIDTSFIAPTGLIDQQRLDMLINLAALRPKTLIITGYSAPNDPENRMFEALQQLIASLTAN